MNINAYIIIEVVEPTAPYVRLKRVCGSTAFYYPTKKLKVKKMNKNDDLYWGDNERIKRAVEIRRKNEKKEVK